MEAYKQIDGSVVGMVSASQLEVPLNKEATDASKSSPKSGRYDELELGL